MTIAPETATPTDNLPTVSGTKVVVAMFALAITATSILWFYWDMHLMPYMPLQAALAEEFENCSPRVDGGQRKMHKGTKMILRVVMRVPFDPTLSDMDVQDQIETRITRTRELAETRVSNFYKFETLEVHMYYQLKEKTIQQKTFEKTLKESVPPDA